MSVRPQTQLIGPQHDGRAMSLERFARAEAVDDRIYELERGEIVVVDVPGVPHERIRELLRDKLAAYRQRRPGTISMLSDGAGSVVRAWTLQSERHPDLTIYLRPPPNDSEQPWDEWIPDIVVEVVSKSSRTRDYVTKAQEYLAAGVRQYWVIDPLNSTATIHHRRGDTWRKEKLSARATLKCGMLPGFALKLSELFRAAR